MKIMLDFNKNGVAQGIDNMQVWLIFCGLDMLLQGDRRFFADKEELQNNVKYISDYLNTFGKNALFENKFTKRDAKRYLTILSKLTR
jgi:hypothetical protein